MALLESELEEIRYELGWSNLTTGAEPYIGIAAIFDRVVAPYLRSGLITTSSTAVAAATTPTQRSITLAAVTGTNTQGTTVTVSAGDRLIIDVDSQQEAAIVQSISGSVVTVMLSLAHAGTYPVTVEGGEAKLREILRACRDVSARIARSMGRAGVKKVDEIEFFEKKTGGSTVLSDLVEAQRYWRGELYRLLFGTGDKSLVGGGMGGAGGLVSVY